MRDSCTSLHIFGVPHEETIRHLRTYLDTDMLQRRIEIMQSGKKLTQDEERLMFHYYFRAHSQHNVYLFADHASVYWETGPSPDVERNARDLSGLVQGKVLFFSAFECDPVMCGVCSHGDTVTMLVRGNGRDRELTRCDMRMKEYCAFLDPAGEKRIPNYNRIDKFDLAAAVTRDAGVILSEEHGVLQKCRGNAVSALLYEQENLAIYDTAASTPEKREERMQRYGIQSAWTEQSYSQRILASAALGFLMMAENGIPMPPVPPRSAAFLQDLLSFCTRESSGEASEVIRAVLNPNTVWESTWIAEKKKAVLAQFRNIAP